MSHHRNKRSRVVICLIGLVALASLLRVDFGVSLREEHVDDISIYTANSSLALPASIVPTLSPVPEQQADFPQKELTNTAEPKVHPKSSPPPPPFLHGNLRSGNYSKGARFPQGYRPSGGSLPQDLADFLKDPRIWKFVDNSTCIHQDDINEDLEWQKRAPYALLLGAMKAGTHAVMESLWEHPLVARTGHWEGHFYDSHRAIRSSNGIHQMETRRYYAEAMRRGILNFTKEMFLVHNTTTTMTTGGNDTAMMPNDNNNNNKNVTVADMASATTTTTATATAYSTLPMMAIESSPRYLLNSDRIPDMIMCVTPWVKLIAILRDPIARAESHYRFLDESRRANNIPMVDWDTWIQDDIRLLTEAGVLVNASHKNSNSPLQQQQQQQEYLAWKTYQRRPNSQQIVGRGLYIISIEQYLMAMTKAGKPKSDLLILQSERFRNPSTRQEEYNRLLSFLDLFPHNLGNSFTTNDIHTTSQYNDTISMPEHIRRQLQELYRPYNARLYKLLGWKNVWE